MIRLIDREEVFYKSWLVDHYISELQRSRYTQEGYNRINFLEEFSLQEEDPYDHFDAYHDYSEELDDFAVLRYHENIQDYLKHRSIAFLRFFEAMEIKRLFLLDELKYDLVKFPFSYREKREAFINIVNQPSYSEALELDIEELPIILPLFHYSRKHSEPIIWFFSSDVGTTLAMFLCDDANFHTSFLSKDREKITEAVSNSGLIMGGIEICRL